MRNFITVAFATALIALASAFAGYAQTVPANILDRKVSINIEKQSFRKVLKQLTVNLDIPVGLELSAADRTSPELDFEVDPPPGDKQFEMDGGRTKITIHIEEVFAPTKRQFSLRAENVPLRKVLDRLVRQMPGYKWRESDGVVNIYPKRDRYSVFEKFLALRVARYAIKKRPVLWIGVSLYSLPEVKRFLVANGLRNGDLRTGSADVLNRKLEAELVFSGIDMLDLLNAIVRVKRGGWILKSYVPSSPGSELLEVII